jgi:hypothetical protein
LLFFYWNCPDSVVYCCFSWILELSWKCAILLFFIGFWNCPDSVALCYFSIRTVLTVWYLVVFLLEFGTVLTVW